jgi:TolB-like protein/Flp pilus assembly protein TadD/predicted Ser/Thr protein kinase
MIGRVLGHYTVIEQVGAGGMGVVYRARDERLERDVALKVLSTGSLGTDQARSQLRKEALALAQLSHAHVGAVYDFDTHDGVDFLVMEFVAGRTLADRLHHGLLPEREVLTLAAQIARALEDAHEHGIVHRDLKPGNIMVTQKGVAKVLDFGLARILAHDARAAEAQTMPATQLVAGTLPYMSPEQLRQENADARSDIHALGAVIYEMATGRRAFPENQGPPLVDAILNRPPVTPRAFNPHLSTELERIVLKCLEKDPDQRYQSAREAAIDLERLKSPGSHTTMPATIGRGRIGAFAAVVAALAIGGALALNVGGWRDRAFGGETRPRIESLAVLPLENLSGDKDREYFADGMTDALITELSRITALKVISRTSVMPYKGAGKSLTQIASELGVDGVIEGSVLHDGDQVRIAVQLIQGATDRHLWSDSYQREVGSVLALQNDVARAVAREIRVALTPQDERRLASTDVVNRDAYDLYLKGIQYADQETDEGQTKSIESLEKAVQLDPQFASAHARLALTYTIYYMGGGLEPKQFYPRAKAAALRALEIDDTVSDAYVALANEALSYAWNWPDAERHYKRAIQLNPSNAAAHERYATYFQSIGRFDDALAERNLARDLDPRSPFRIANTGYPLYYAGRYDEAIRRFRQALEADSRFYWANLWIGQALVEQGKYPEAIAEIERAVTLSERNTRVIATLGNAYGLAGRRAEAQAIVNELRTRSRQTYVSAFYLALVYAGLGMRDQAMEQLEKAVEERQPYLAGLNVEPPFLGLHDDPRFQAIVRRIGIPTAR